MPKSIVTLNEDGLKFDLRGLVRKIVEDALPIPLKPNGPVGAERYERAAEREACCAGH